MGRRKKKYKTIQEQLKDVHPEKFQVAYWGLNERHCREEVPDLDERLKHTAILSVEDDDMLELFKHVIELGLFCFIKKYAESTEDGPLAGDPMYLMAIDSMAFRQR